jgi:hypothetical protein
VSEEAFEAAANAAGLPSNVSEEIKALLRKALEAAYAVDGPERVEERWSQMPENIEWPLRGPVDVNEPALNAHLEARLNRIEEAVRYLGRRTGGGTQVYEFLEGDA